MAAPLSSGSASLEKTLEALTRFLQDVGRLVRIVLENF